MANNWIEQLHFADTKLDTKSVLNSYARLRGLRLSCGNIFENLTPDRAFDAQFRPQPPLYLIYGEGFATFSTRKGHEFYHPASTLGLLTPTRVSRQLLLRMRVFRWPLVE